MHSAISEQHLLLQTLDNFRKFDEAFYLLAVKAYSSKCLASIQENAYILLVNYILYLFVCFIVMAR